MRQGNYSLGAALAALLLLLAVGSVLYFGGRPKPPIKAPETGTLSRGSLDRLPSETRRSLAYPSCRALLVGINDYRASGFSSLAGPNLDASELAAVLVTRYGFQDVTLLVDQRPAFAIPGGLKAVVEPCVTREVIDREVKALAGRAGRSDALLFFYAGHGLRGALAPGRSDPARPTSLLPLDKLVGGLRRAEAHHTLAVLDCCFSGRILERESGCDEAVGDLGTGLRRWGTGDNLARVFAQRAFQVISAGTGGEVVGDQVKIAEQFVHLARDASGHSPFTAALLQALHGLAGRADGLVLASELGYHMNYRLVNDARIGASQAPRHGRLGNGAGDFVFVPAHRVLNPDLVAPLYRTGEQYGALREAACFALRQSITEEQPAPRRDLLRDVLPHLRRLLFDPSPRTRLAAARVLADLATKYANDTEDFRTVVLPTLQAARAAGRNASKPAEARQFQADTARILGSLARHTTPEGEAFLDNYVRNLKADWTEATREALMPPQVVARLAAAPKGPPPQSGMERMRFLEAERSLYQWLADEGKALVTRHENQEGSRLEAQISGLEAQLEQLKGAARGSDDPARRVAWEKAAAVYVKLRALSPSALGRRWVELAQRARDGGEAVRSLLMETAEDRHRSLGSIRRLGEAGRVRAVAISPDGKRILSGGDRLILWDAASGRPEQLIAAHSDEVLAVAWSRDGRQIASGSKDGSVELRAAAGIRLLATLRGSSAVTACAFSPKGDRFLSAHQDGSLRLWVEGPWRIVSSIKGPGGALTSCAFAPDGHLFAASSVSGSLWV